WHSFRSAFGFGRGAKAKVVPAVALLALCLPPAVDAFAMAKGSARLLSYDTYEPTPRVLLLTLFVAAPAPPPLSPAPRTRAPHPAPGDLRARWPPLSFARPIETIDYPLAKFAAFTGACAVLLEAPLLLLYAGTIVNVHGGAAVWAQTRALIPGMLVALMWSVALAAISLFLAS